MRRRSFLAATAMGATMGVTGCLEGEPVAQVNTSERVAAHSGWVREITEPSGAGEISYNVESEHNRFEVFYFRDEGRFRTYEQVVFGSAEMPDEPPEGYNKLRGTAIENGSGVYTAEMPTDGSRYDIDFDGTHYFVVDNSNYGNINVESTTEHLPVVINLEVVEDRF
jgi:hypothetical protein